MVDVAVFDMYYLLVDVLFGSVLWAGLAMAIIYIIVASLMKVSPLLQMFILGFFAITFGIGYGGSIFAVAGFIFGFMYFVSGLINALFAKVYT